MQYIDEYECDLESCSDEDHSELESHQRKAKKSRLCCNKKKKKNSGDGDDYFKSLFSFDKIFETLNTVQRLER